MFEFHKDKERYFDMQFQVTKNYVQPFIAEHIPLDKPLNVLEIGCAEAGVLKAFTALGHTCTGIELNESRLETAAAFMKEEVASGQINFICRNIYDIDVAKDIPEKFDLVLLKDVIEHIPDQAKFMLRLREFLKPTGKVFFGFPPWQMPFGGHQQICKNKWGGRVPFYHLLPKPLYNGVLQAMGEPEPVVKELLEIKDTGISIERFESIAKKANFTLLKRKLFFINPIYKYKFNLKPRTQSKVLGSIPYFRNYYSTCAYYLIGLN